MRNQFDFYDARLNWRNNIGPDGWDQNRLLRIINEEITDDEMDWFFPGVDYEHEIPMPPVNSIEPVRQPVIYISYMNLKCEVIEHVPVYPDEFVSFEEFKQSIPRHIWISVDDADDCDFDRARDILDSEDIFYEIANVKNPW